VLNLRATGLSAVGLEALLSSGHLASLRHLYLSECPLNDAGALVLARWPGLANLHTLDLCETGLQGGALELARSPYRRSLQELHLSNNDLIPEEARQAFRELEESGRLLLLGETWE
jgi:hypothetical protein